MAARPSPFKSRCLAILNFKNGACILSAHLSFFLQRRSFRGLVYFHPGIPHLKTLSGPQGGATECIVYAAIRETYCRPANNERFPRGGSLYSLRSAGKFTALATRRLPPGGRRSCVIHAATDVQIRLFVSQGIFFFHGCIIVEKLTG